MLQPRYRGASHFHSAHQDDKQSEWVIVHVWDYGKRLPPELAGRMSSAGLGVSISGMRERVRQLGGEPIILRAEPGTLVEAKIPLFGSDFGSREFSRPGDSGDVRMKPRSR